MTRLILLFFFASIVAIFLSAAGIYHFDFQLDKVSLVILLAFALFIGFLIGSFVSYRSDKIS